MDITLPTVAILVSVSAVEFLQTRLIAESDQKLWVEWSAWAFLLLSSLRKRKFMSIGTRSGNDTSLENQSTVSELQNGMLPVTLIASCLFLSRLFWTISARSIWWAAPIVSIVVFVFHPYLGRLQGSQILVSFGLGSSRIHSSSTQSSLSKKAVWQFYGIMVASYSLLFLSTPATGMQSIVTGSLYVVLQAVVYVLLGQHGAVREEKAGANLWPHQSSFLRIYAQGFLMWTLYNISTTRQFKLGLSTIVVGLLRSIQLHSVLILVLLIFTLSRASTDAEQATNDTLLAPVTLSTALLISTLCIDKTSLIRRIPVYGLTFTALLQLISILPKNASRRKWLFLLIIPICALAGILTVNQNLEREKLATSVTYNGLHPVESLVQKARAQFELMVESQSKTLGEAVTSYARRYRRNPPPGFDKWFELAQKEEYVLVDEFDSIMESLEPFWGVAPSLLRRNVDSARDAALIVRVGVKDHQIDHLETHKEIWQAETIDGWLERYGWLDILPDMSFLVNLFDEPRVIAPLNIVAAAKANAGWRTPPAELPSFLKETPDVAWLDLSMIEPWQAMSASCPVDSPARDETLEMTDQPYLLLPFVSNLSESQDVCQQANLRHSQGFLVSPASFSITHSLLPVFSHSKPSIFNDILYPSIWYWIKMSVNDYKAEEDVGWVEKKDNLYWTGSATGGSADVENWRHLHRQRLVLKTAHDSKAHLTLLQRDPGSELWKSYNTEWSNVSHMFDIRITAVNAQCTEEACEAMRDAFHLTSHKDGAEETEKDRPGAAYASKYVLDIDGNTFSGRFYRLLESKCAVLKQTIFKEWHDGRLIPWVHFIPVSPSAAELGEIMRFLTEEDAGKWIGRDIAFHGREWAKKTLRMVDLEVTFLRILLEYGRIVSDDRDTLGYVQEQS